MVSHDSENGPESAPGGGVGGRYGDERRGWLPLRRAGAWELVAAYLEARASAGRVVAAVLAVRARSRERLAGPAGGAARVVPGLDRVGRPVVRVLTGRLGVRECGVWRHRSRGRARGGPPGRRARRD